MSCSNLAGVLLTNARRGSKETRRELLTKADRNPESRTRVANLFLLICLPLQNTLPLAVLKMCLDTVLFLSKCFHFLLTLLYIRRERWIFSTYC